MTAALARRIAACDWPAIERALDERGFAVTPPLLDAADCADLTALYARDEAFRNRIVMQRHGFGQGEYRYFAYPLPGPVQELREALYARLAPAARRWAAALGGEAAFAATLEGYLARCHAAGQRRPTPLLLKYGAGDYNCLHQDLYGDLAFPFQATLLLSAPARDFAGGHFVLTEQRPRRQSRAEVVALAQGEAVIFAVNERPAETARGHARARMRHGVSTVARGTRLTLGIIFHDAA